MSHGQQPGREFALHVVCVQGTKRLHERVLRKLLGACPIAHDSDDDTEHRPLVALHDLTKRGLGTVEGPTNQLTVCGSHSLLCPTSQSFFGLQSWQRPTQPPRLTPRIDGVACER